MTGHLSIESELVCTSLRLLFAFLKVGEKAMLRQLMLTSAAVDEFDYELGNPKEKWLLGIVYWGTPL